MTASHCLVQDLVSPSWPPSHHFQHMEELLIWLVVVMFEAVPLAHLRSDQQCFLIDPQSCNSPLSRKENSPNFKLALMKHVNMTKICRFDFLGFADGPHVGPMNLAIRHSIFICRSLKLKNWHPNYVFMHVWNWHPAIFHTVTANQDDTLCLTKNEFVFMHMCIITMERHNFTVILLATAGVVLTPLMYTNQSENIVWCILHICWCWW